jgi:hypothetical protein
MSIGVNLSARLIVCPAGCTHRITNMFDCRGEETEDAAEAVAVVFHGDGAWIAMAVDDLEPVTVN